VLQRACIKYSKAMGVLNFIADCCSIQKEHVAVIQECVAMRVLQYSVFFFFLDGCSAKKEYVAVIMRKCRGDSLLLHLQKGLNKCVAVYCSA